MQICLHFTRKINKFVLFELTKLPKDSKIKLNFMLIFAKL